MRSLALALGSAACLALVAPRAEGSEACRWLPTVTARRAAEVAANAVEQMRFDALRPAAVGAVAVRDHGGGTAELLLDGEAVDLFGLFVRARDADWIHLGHLAPGCSTSRVPARAAARPFVPLAAAETARLPPPVAPAWIALAELPSVLPQWDERPAAPIAVRAEPRDDAAVSEELVRGGELPVAEWSYEQAGAFVLEQRGDWVRIRLAGGAGWIRRAEAEPIHPLAALVVDGLAYLTAAWDGLLHSAPGERTSVARIDPVWRQRLFEADQVPIEALETRTVDGAVWLRVRVTSRHCVDSGVGTHIWAEGWLPLAGRDGVPALGFYARGC